MKTAGQSTVCCRCAPVIVAEYTRESDGSPVTVIIEALTRATGVDQADLPPLYEVVDPDAINALFERHGGAENANALLSFRIETWNVFIRGDRLVGMRVDPLDSDLGRGRVLNDNWVAALCLLGDDHHSRTMPIASELSASRSA
ncbi:MAG: HalOD1 output domain-containing protein [Halobacteriota archaeon]